MPFTTSHPAIVLPLKKLFPNYISLSGLMAGAMSPDLLYFLNLTTVNRGISHTWLGLITFCIPAGFIFAIVFHLWIKQSFLLNLPNPLDRYLSGLALSDWKINSPKKALILLISVAIGALSHFFWDAFTHLHGELTSFLPFLHHKVNFFGQQLHLTYILQQLSTVVGGLFIVIYLWKAKLILAPVDNFKPNAKADKIRFWVMGIFASTIFTTAVCLMFDNYLPQHPVSYRAIAGLSSWAGLFYYTIGYTLLTKRKSLKLAYDN